MKIIVFCALAALAYVVSTFTVSYGEEPASDLKPVQVAAADMAPRPAPTSSAPSAEALVAAFRTQVPETVGTAWCASNSSPEERAQCEDAPVFYAVYNRKIPPTP